MKRIPAHTFNSNRKVVSVNEFRRDEWLYTTQQCWGDIVIKLYNPKKFVNKFTYKMDYFEIKLYKDSNSHSHSEFMIEANKEVRSLMNILKEGGSPEDYATFMML